MKEPAMFYGQETELHYLWGLVDSFQVVGKIPVAHKQGMRYLNLAQEVRLREGNKKPLC
jgi:hypothetical protein